MTDQEHRVLTLVAALTDMFRAMDLHPEFQPWKVAPADFADAFVRVEDAWIDVNKHSTARTARAERKAGAGR